MELFFLIVLVLLMVAALGSGFPVAFALPGSAVLTILLAGGAGLVFAGDPSAYFFNGGPWQWLSAGVTNLRSVYWVVERDTLIAVPLFIFMGIMLQKSKIAEDLLVTMAQLFGPVPGGLGISVVFVGALLAATTGIVGATVVAMGLISLPAMMRSNYSTPLATGTIAASGTLGQIIPPSIVLIILADQLSSATDQAGVLRQGLYKAATGEFSMPSIFDVGSTSAGEMFLGALIPGLVLVGLYMLYILVFALIRPQAAPAVHTEGTYSFEFWKRVTLTLVPPLTLIFLVLGSIIAGVATVNQAGAIGAAGAMVMAGYRLHERDRDRYWPAILGIVSLGVLVYALQNYDMNVKLIRDGRDMAGIWIGVAGSVGLLVSLVWSGLRVLRINRTMHGVMLDTAKTTSLVFVILMGAAILTSAFRAFGGEELVREFLNGLPGGFWAKFIVVMAVIFILGFFLDFIEISVVVVPIVAPILLADPGANVTAVWLGVMIGLNIQTSFLTPPFGFALFYLRGVAPAAVKTLQIYKGVIPFILLQLTALVIVAWYPPLVNYLPARVNYLSETAPPPRNPKLQPCLEQYVAEKLAASDDVPNAIARVRGLDVSLLPDKLAKEFRASIDSAEAAIASLEEAERAAEKVAEAAEAYRPIRARVRDIEKDIRRLEADREEVRTEIERIREGEQPARKLRLEDRLARIDAEIDALKSRIPAEWEETHATFSALVKAEDDARKLWRRNADASYEGIARLVAVLDATAEFEALEEPLREMRGIVETRPEAETHELVNQLAKRFNAVEGAGDVKKLLSKARRKLKDKRKPDREKALEYLDQAIAEYEAQKAWRDRAAQALRPELSAYIEVIRGTLGIRVQPRFTREQALYMASCAANHRDISLSF